MMPIILAAINAAFILGGTVGGLVLSSAELIYWILLFPLAVLFCITLRYNTTNTIPNWIASILGFRAYILLVLTILGVTTLLSQLENWRQLIGFLSGCFCGLWLDWVQKFRRDRVVMSWQGKVIITMKILSIFMMDISLMISGQVQSHMMLYIFVLVFSQFFGTTLTELITTNIRGVIGQQIPLATARFKLYAIVDILISGVFLIFAFINKSHFYFIICATAHLIVTAFGYIQVAALKKQQVVIEMPQLKEIVVVVNPAPDGIVDFCVGKQLST